MSESDRSVTFTALVFFGLLVALVGLVLVVLDFGGVITFEASIDGITLKTTSVGLAVLAIGSAISAGVALNLPEGVQVFGERRRMVSERLRQWASLFVIVAGIAAVLFVISLVV